MTMNSVIQEEKTDKEIKEIHRKRILQLSLKSLGEISQLEEPDYEQKAWIIRKMRRSFT